MDNSLAVVYLARFDEDIRHIENFLDSYVKHSSGIKHDLVIAAKGFESKESRNMLLSILSGVSCKIIYVKDDIGYDIHVYRYICNIIDHEFVFLCNTFSVILSDNWLYKFYKSIKNDNVAIVGSTGSYESLYNSFKVISCIDYMAKKCFLGKELYDMFESQLSEKIKRRYKNFIKKNIEHIKCILFKHNIEYMKKKFKEDFSLAVNEDGNFFRDIAKFPRFPNPHIRSNAFIIRRDKFLSLEFDDTSKNKIDCCEFESGYSGMSRTFLKQGMKLLIIDNNGHEYEPQDWVSFGLFRNNYQENLIIGDNQTRQYNELSDKEKYKMRVMTYGNYADLDERYCSILGTDFIGKKSITDICRDMRCNDSIISHKKFSVVVPCHGKGYLLKELIKTVKFQNYQEWEIVIFDNASSPPISNELSEFDDKKIYCRRSDEFLSVTDSWNNAISMANGEYIIFLGNDDALAPGCFNVLNKLINEYNNPDLIMSSMYQFIYPCVMKSKKYIYGCFRTLEVGDFLEDKNSSFILKKEKIEESLINSITLNRSFFFNLPSFAIKKEFIERIKIDNNVFLSPFPDYYLAQILLGTADKVVVNPKPVSIQGVSRKSFGAEMFNNSLDDGFKYLNNEKENTALNELNRRLLPGSRYQSEYIITMGYAADILTRYGYTNMYIYLENGIKKYRHIQMRSFLEEINFNIIKLFNKKSINMIKRLNYKEILWIIKSIIINKVCKIIFRSIRDEWDKKYTVYAFSPVQIDYNTGKYINIYDAFKDIENGGVSNE